MRILHVTSQAPDVNSGGAIGIIQSMYSLVNQDAEVDYVGPVISNEEIKKNYANKYRKLYELKPTNSMFKTLLTILRGQINRTYFEWKKLHLDLSKYDVVFLDFTRQDYIFKDVNKKNKTCKKIVRLHNVEYDYTRTDFKKNKSLENAIVYLFAKKQEKNVLRLSDCVLALTENDSRRIQELYNINKGKIEIVPVCVTPLEDKPESVVYDEGTVKLLITGSLWFGPNVEGVIWFIENVVDKLNINYSLTIAGYKPNDIIKEMCKKRDIRLVDSPKDMAPLFKECDVVIAPIFDGAGMKVKVAEALSYGKTVMSTSHGLIGYNYKNGEGVYKCYTPEEFIESIKCYSKLDVAQREVSSAKAYELYDKNYSLESSVRYVKRVLAK